MKYFLVFLTFCIFLFSCKESQTSEASVNPEEKTAKINGQESIKPDEAADSKEKQVLLDAEAMVSALVNINARKLADYTYPALFEQAGGKDGYIQAIESSFKLQKEKGTTFDNVLVSEPSPIVKCNGQLQCVLKQEITISMVGQNAFQAKSNLIAISVDDGKSWKFINAADKDIAEVQKVYANICSDLPLRKF